jgi:hypothetical protein
MKLKLPAWVKDPKKAGRFHMWATIFFLVQIPIALLTGLKESVPYLVFLSLWALVGAHWSAWQATRAEDNSS